MKHKPLLLLVAASILWPSGVFAQKPLSETDLLKQIEALTPTRPAAAKNEVPSGPVSLFDPSPGTSAPGADRKEKSTEKKAKGATEITSQEAIFDNKANIAVFVGDVVVKDPEFNCMCDKLTTHLKKKVPASAAGTQPTPTPGSTPAPNQQRGGGLERAIAESTSDRRVILTQEKIEADGTITHSFGKADKAIYDPGTGDIMLYGSPEVTQGPQRMVALTPETVIILNRDGKLSSKGQTKAYIVDGKN